MFMDLDRRNAFILKLKTGIWDGLRRYSIYLLGAVILLLYIHVVLLQTDVYETMVIEEGQVTFTAEFDYVSYVVPVNEDPGLADAAKSGVVATIHILDASGSLAADITIDGGEVYTNGNTLIPDLLKETGNGFYLTEGDTYSIQYWCYADGLLEEELSFVLYGTSVPMTEEAIALILLTAVLMTGLRLSEPWGDRSLPHRENAGFVLIFLAIAGMLLISLPVMNAWDAERTAFADAYALSSSLLNRETVDEEGFVYIAESGIRNMKYISETNSLHQFWTAWYDGTESAKVSSLYQTSGGQPSLLTWIDALAIALARLLHMPYQIVYLSGKLANLLIGLVMLLLVLRLMHGKKQDDKGQALYKDPATLLILTLFLLPSTIQGLLSYQIYGIVAVSGILAAVLLHRYICIRNSNQRRRHIYFALTALACLSCTIGVVRILIGGGNPLMVFTNAVISNADLWLMGTTVLWPQESTDLRLTASIIFVLLVFIWLDFQVGDKAGKSKSYSRWNYPGVAVIFAGIAALILSGSIEYVNNAEMSLSYVPSVVLLPLMLVIFTDGGGKGDPEGLYGKDLGSEGGASAEFMTGAMKRRMIRELIVLMIAFMCFRCVTA